MEVCSLSSGSKGNCIFIDTGKTKLLVDVGISARSLKTRADARGIDLNGIDGVLITHEHTDHIRGVESFCKNFTAPIYCHPQCKDAIIKSGNIPYAGDNNQYELGFEIGGAIVQPFRTPHDSAFSCGYRISWDGKSVSIVTDLGVLTNGVYENIVGSDMVYIESNHDIDMLTTGNYPYALKRRILGDRGHLSNLACSVAVRRLYEDGTNKFMLAHLSQENNRVDLAYNASNNQLIELQAEKYILEVATQDAPSKIIEV